MARLTDYLEGIQSWLQKNKFALAPSLQPGLTPEQIQENIEDLPFFLPLELYELYQWKNGVYYGDEDFSMFFPPYAFYSLEVAREEYDKLIEKAEKFAEDNWVDPSEIWNPKWFPVFSFQGDYICILGNEEVCEVSPVLEIFRDVPDITIQYSSLTNMMRTILECYETGAYYISECGDMEVDEGREESIRIQYNSVE